MFAAFQWKIINSVFLTFKESLLAFNHCDKLLRSWFSFLAKTSSDSPDTSQVCSQGICFKSMVNTVNAQITFLKNYL